MSFPTRFEIFYCVEIEIYMKRTQDKGFSAIFLEASGRQRDSIA